MAEMPTETVTLSLLCSDLDNVTLRSLGHHALKDIDERIELYQVTAPGLIENFPALLDSVAAPRLLFWPPCEHKQSWLTYDFLGMGARYIATIEAVCLHWSLGTAHTVLGATAFSRSNRIHPLIARLAWRLTVTGPSALK